MEEPQKENSTPEEETDREKPVEPETEKEVTQPTRMSDKKWYFLRAAVLLGLAIWFSYDGWLNKEQIQEWIEEGKEFTVWFNRGLGVIFFIGMLYFGIRGKLFKEPPASTEEHDDSPPEQPS